MIYCLLNHLYWSSNGCSLSEFGLSLVWIRKDGCLKSFQTLSEYLLYLCVCSAGEVAGHSLLGAVRRVEYGSLSGGAGHRPLSHSSTRRQGAGGNLWQGSDECWGGRDTQYVSSSQTPRQTCQRWESVSLWMAARLQGWSESLWTFSYLAVMKLKGVVGDFCATTVSIMELQKWVLHYWSKV